MYDRTETVVLCRGDDGLFGSHGGRGLVQRLADGHGSLNGRGEDNWRGELHRSQRGRRASQRSKRPANSFSLTTMFRRLVVCLWHLYQVIQQGVERLIFSVPPTSANRVADLAQPPVALAPPPVHSLPIELLDHIFSFPQGEHGPKSYLKSVRSSAGVAGVRHSASYSLLHFTQTSPLHLRGGGLSRPSHSQGSSQRPHCGNAPDK